MQQDKVDSIHSQRPHTEAAIRRGAGRRAAAAVRYVAPAAAVRYAARARAWHLAHALSEHGAGGIFDKPSAPCSLLPSSLAGVRELEWAG